jgi:hypothetical protein
MINEARKKDAGVDLPYIAEILQTMPRREFEDIQWIKKPGWEIFRKDLDNIVFDMMNA